MINTNNMDNATKWTYNHLLQQHYWAHGEYPKGQKLIPNIRLKVSDLEDDPVKFKRKKAELVEINTRRALEGC